MEDAMTGIRRAPLVMGVCAAVAADAAWAEDRPFVGRWPWNRAQSTLPPGEPGLLATPAPMAGSTTVGDTGVMAGVTRIMVMGWDAQHGGWGHGFAHGHAGFAGHAGGGFGGGHGWGGGG